MSYYRWKTRRGVRHEHIISCRHLGMFWITVGLWTWAIWVRILHGMVVGEVN